MVPDAFAEWLVRQVGEIRVEGESEGDAFARWTMARRFELSEPETFDMSGFRARGGGDLGLDGYWMGPGGSQLTLLQAKFSAKPSDYSVGVEAVRALVGAYETLLDKQYAVSVDEELGVVADALETSRGAGGDIVLAVSAAGRVTNSAREQGLQMLQALPEPRPRLEFWDLDYWYDDAPDFEGDEDLTGRRFEIAHAGALSGPSASSELFGIGKVFVASLSARSLAESLGPVRSKAVQANVRYHLGNKGINKKILNSLKEDGGPPRFWLRNNGLVILCDDVSDEGTHLSLVNPQVVNGAQTLFSIASVGAGLEDAWVLAKVIQLTGDSESRSSISADLALSSNQQTKVSPSDLKSNQPEQFAIEREMNLIDPPWLYERRRNQRVATKNRRRLFGDRVVDKEAYAQHLYAYLGSPAMSVKSKSAVFQEEGEDRYRDIFLAGRDVRQGVLAHVLFRSLAADTAMRVKAAVSATESGVSQGAASSVWLLVRRLQTLWSAHGTALIGEVERNYLNAVDPTEWQALSESVLQDDAGGRALIDGVQSLLSDWLLNLAHVYRRMPDRVPFQPKALLEDPVTFDDLWAVLDTRNQLEGLAALIRTGMGRDAVG